MLAATRTFARVRAASAPEAAISLRRFAAPAGAAAGPSDASGAPPSRGTPFPPPPPRSAIDPPLSPTPRARPGSLRASRSLRSPRISSSLPPSSRRAAPDAAAVPADISASASPPGGSPTTGGARGRIPATIVRETYEGVSASYSVSHGDTLRGYPTMTLREMLASVDARYAAGAMPAERHVAQLVDKVADADDAAEVAGAMAKFRASRLSRAVSSRSSSPGTTLRRDGYLGENALLMFISACARDSADPRRAMDVAIRVAEARHVHGVRVGRSALLALLARSVDAGQIARVYEIWRAVDPPVDVDAVCADAVVKALVRVGEAGMAEASARAFRDAGVGIGEETRRALEEAIAAEERGKGEEAEEADGDGEGEGDADRVVVAGAEGEPEGTEGEEGLR